MIIVLGVFMLVFVMLIGGVFVYDYIILRYLKEHFPNEYYHFKKYGKWRKSPLWSFVYSKECKALNDRTLHQMIKKRTYVLIAFCVYISLCFACLHVFN